LKIAKREIWGQPPNSNSRSRIVRENFQFEFGGCPQISLALRRDPLIGSIAGVLIDDIDKGVPARKTGEIVQKTVERRPQKSLHPVGGMW